MELKFHFFPAAFPDETLHSVLSRYARLCGGSSLKAAFAHLHAPSFTQNVALPSRLSYLVESLPHGTDLSVAQIIQCHTVLPYFAPFLTTDQLQHAHASMAGDGKGLMLKLGINASRIESASRVRFCAVCLSEDVAQVGAAYWHRVHQLSGVLVCPHHGQLLKVVDPGWHSRNSRELNLPDDDGVQAHSVQLNASIDALPGLHKIALSSQQLLGSGLGPLPASAVRSCLLQNAAALGLTHGATYRLDLRRLAEYMASFFKVLPAAWEYSVLGDSPAGLPATWVTKLLRRPRGTHHPLKYIVLASALEVDLAHIMRNDKPSVSEYERSSPIAVRSSKTDLTETVPEGLGGLPAEVWKLALAGHDARQIADKLGVSQVYVYRTIRAVKVGPNVWREARFQSERLLRRANFEKDYHSLQAHQCRGYAWLYRSDRVWLRDHIDKYGDVHASRADTAGAFAILDAELAEQISECAQRLRSGSGKPVRISRTRIGRELHVLPRFEKQLDRLPICASALEQACESVEQFRLRRLHWAEAKLLDGHKSVTHSALYRTACIRPECDLRGTTKRL